MFFLMTSLTAMRISTRQFINVSRLHYKLIMKKWTYCKVRELKFIEKDSNNT